MKTNLASPNLTLLDNIMFRVAPESGSGSGQNPAFFPNPAKIRLRSKFRRSRMLLPDVKNAQK